MDLNDANSRSIDIAIGARRYTIESDDDYLAQLGSRFEPQTVRLLSTLFASGSVVLDVGANIGCTVLLFAQRAGRVIAFEPSPSTFDLLARNVRRAAVANVELHNHALGSRTEASELTFAVNNRSGGFVSAGTPTSSGHVTEPISIVRLDDIAASLALDRLEFVKIDVEGFESSVLEGARDTIDRFTPVVALELNHWCLNAFHRICVPDFLERLCARFPLLLAVDGDNYLDVHAPDERYIVMYHHINHFRYVNLVAAFHEDQLATFYAKYRHSS